MMSRMVKRAEISPEDKLGSSNHLVGPPAVAEIIANDHHHTHDHHHHHHHSAAESDHNHSCVEHDLQIHDNSIHGHEHIIDRYDHGHNHSHGGAIIHSNHVGAYLLELGIASHSLLIGITLGSSRAEFKTLLIAIAFHQFFEGIAVSSVVIESNFTRKFQIFVMILVFCCVTPMGMIIGILVQTLVAQNEPASIIIQGIMDALASGILVYDGLVNIVLPHFHGKLYLSASPIVQSFHFVSFWLGAMAMSVLGIWS
jgi:zinc transporter 1/2/3